MVSYPKCCLNVEMVQQLVVGIGEFMNLLRRESELKKEGGCGSLWYNP